VSPFSAAIPVERDVDRKDKERTMASLSETSPVSVPALLSAKRRERIAMMTAYDAPTARLLDEAGIDVLLVGDSVEMTVYGEDSTLSATMDSMIRHARAVARAAKRALVVGDMPFLSYQAETAAAVRNAGRFLSEAGCAAIKVEGGRRILSAVQAILAADIPVMGHVGLTPQSFRKLGGYKVQGREAESAREIVEDAKALADAGCFALVLECVPDTLAAEITRTVAIPTVGIGAGAACDGQVLVFHDAMGLNQSFKPKFVRRYADLAGTITQAARGFARDVKSGDYPNAEESFSAVRTPALRRVY
jgi:3-methyl-2-oxobutanoate hydroxymethyltransferase